jgi:MFS superfamily sulfate permease-like transporter
MVSELSMCKLYCIIYEIFLPNRLTHLQGDIIAGITVGLTVIPQSIAYANIAELPPQVSNASVMILQIIIHLSKKIEN